MPEGHPRRMNGIRLNSSCQARPQWRKMAGWLEEPKCGPVLAAEPESWARGQWRPRNEGLATGGPEMGG